MTSWWTFCKPPLFVRKFPLVVVDIKTSNLRRKKNWRTLANGNPANTENAREQANNLVSNVNVSKASRAGSATSEVCVIIWVIISYCFSTENIIYDRGKLIFTTGQLKQK